MLEIIAGIYPSREHWGHLLGVAPYTQQLACSLMHLFMHGGRGGHARHGHQDKFVPAEQDEH